MSKDDPFGDALSRALNRDPWAIPGEKKKEPAGEIPPEVGDMWGKRCPSCGVGWLYYAPPRIIACFGRRFVFDDDPDGCGAKWRTR